MDKRAGKQVDPAAEEGKEEGMVAAAVLESADWGIRNSVNLHQRLYIDESLKIVRAWHHHVN